uniref:Calx-beta domain-containing protein n=1 Tax=Dunaliella tertiolecta TaxID=3047 RepID=A0A7S3VKC0_DUNTE
MAEANGAQAYKNVLSVVKKELKECTESYSGTCWELPPPGRGYIIWSDARAECSNSVILVPGFNLLHKGILIAVYALFLIWLFFGIAICSDIFTEAIENIYAHTRKVRRKHPRTGEDVVVEEKVWNWVVANISLMAFGTSAPEILLSIVETLTQLGSKGGQLGASTIVGSAAYNYFLIPGICSAALPAGHFRKLEHVYVFICTALWSVWAYVWVFLVLSVISPGEVEVWEGFVTLAFFPLMVLTAYAVDKKFWLWSSGQASIPPFDLEENPEEDTGAGGQQIGKGYEKGRAPPAGASCTLRTFSSTPGSSIAHPKQKHSILYYRMLTVRHLAGESKTPEMLALSHNPLKEGTEFHDHEVGTLSGRFMDRMQKEEAAPEGASKLGFSSLHYSVLESQCVARVVVRRSGGDLDAPVSVGYATKDGTAVAHLDYQPVQGVLKFGPGEVSKEIEISIIDDDMSEPDVTFCVVLSDLQGVGVVLVQDMVPVTIVDDDESGILMFELPTKEASVEDAFVDLPVIRRNGMDGMVTVDYATQDGTGPAAVAGQHYKETKGTLVLESGEDRAKIRIPLLAAGGNKMLVFKIVLSNPLGGAVLGKRAMCRIILVPGRNAPSKIKSNTKRSRRRSKCLKGEEEEEFSLWKAYKEQYQEAIMPELQDGANNVWFDMLLHYTSITWKLICASIPPSEWAGSYPTFLGSNIILVGIIFLTKEVANLLGCELTLSPVMTGLTLVALGTSLPDTFASRMAAIHDETADAAIGNITSSNSANVFLGLGLPWIIAAGYFYNRGEPFTVPAGNLGFTLVLWCAGFGAMSIVFAIRRARGGELGGSLKAQRILLAWSIFLWLFFLVLSGVHSYSHFDSDVYGEE